MYDLCRGSRVRDAAGLCVCLWEHFFFCTWRVPCVRRRTLSARSCTTLLYSLAEEQTAPEPRERTDQRTSTCTRMTAGAASSFPHRTKTTSDICELCCRRPLGGGAEVEDSSRALTQASLCNTSELQHQQQKHKPYSSNREEISS